ncbi:MAG: DJ-1/PfpI family protein [Clostridium sp.]
MKKILLLLGDFTEDYEAILPFQLLQTLGYEVDAVCPDKEAGEIIKTAIHDFEGDQTYSEKRGHNFMLNKSFSEIKLEEYCGLYISGGRSSEYIRLNKRVVEIAQYFLKNNKPLGAVCHGPQVLVATKMLKGRKLTAYPTVKPEIEAAGGEFVEVEGDYAVIDGNLVTSQSWAAHISIMKAFLKVLGAKIEI